MKCADRTCYKLRQLSWARTSLALGVAVAALLAGQKIYEYMIMLKIIANFLTTVSLFLASCLTISPTVGQLCPDPLMLPHPPSNSCYSPLDQGPCPAGSWLVEEPDQDPAQLHCQVEQCGQEMILYNDQCYDMFDPAACPRQGERLYLASSGRGECYCDEGWGRGQDGSCYQEFTRGPCNSHQGEPKLFRMHP